MAQTKAQPATKAREYTVEVVGEAVRKLREAKELVPKRDTDGKLDFGDIGSIPGVNDPKDLLDSMIEQGLVQAVAVQTLLACPTCGRVNIQASLKCSKCNSSSITRERLLEHRIGGHIHNESEFTKRGRMICPTCLKQLTDPKEYRVIGAWYKCKSCSEKFANLTPDLVCVTDDKVFSLQTADIARVNKYVLTEKGMEFKSGDKDLLAGTLVTILSSLGSVDRNPSIRGNSGTSHTFDLALNLQNKKLMLDICYAEQEVDEAPILAAFAKVFDTGRPPYLLIGYPKFKAGVTALAKTYGITYVEISSATEVPIKVVPVIQELAKS